MNYMRLTKDNRIIFGGRLAYAFNGDTAPAVDREHAIYAPFAGAFFDAFPQLEGLSFSNAWSGAIDLSTRMAVHFQHYHGVTASHFDARVAFDIR